MTEGRSGGSALFAMKKWPDFKLNLPGRASII